MKYRAGIFLAVFALACLTPVVVFAMGERNQNPRTAHMCDTSSKTKKFVLTSENGEIKETFKVPIRYMSMEFERNGRVNSTLHLEAVLDTLEPRCGVDGEIVAKEKSLTLELLPNLYPENWVKNLRERYSDDNIFAPIELNEYSGFTFKVRKNIPKSIDGKAVKYSDISVYPIEDTGVAADFFIECRLLTDMRSLSLCKARFPYKGNVSVVAMFDAEHLNNFKKIYDSSISLIKKFHVE